MFAYDPSQNNVYTNYEVTFILFMYIPAGTFLQESFEALKIIHPRCQRINIKQGQSKANM